MTDLTHAEYQLMRWEETADFLAKIAARYRALPWWAWRRRRKLLAERQFAKALNFDVLYGAGIPRCTLQPADHGYVELPGGFSGTVPCNGWPCAHVAAQLLAEGAPVPGPNYGDTAPYSFRFPCRTTPLLPE